MGCTNTKSLDNFYFEEKYFNKNFTKTDLINPNIFDVNELWKYIKKYYSQKLVETGINIITTNNNFLLKLHNNLGLKYDYSATIYITDSKNGECYTINHYVHIKHLYTVTLSSANKTYEFPNLSQIELYFDRRQ